MVFAKVMGCVVCDYDGVINFVEEYDGTMFPSIGDFFLMVALEEEEVHYVVEVGG